MMKINIHKTNSFDIYFKNECGTVASLAYLFAMLAYNVYIEK